MLVIVEKVGHLQAKGCAVEINESSIIRQIN